MIDFQIWFDKSIWRREFYNVICDTLDSYSNKSFFLMIECFEWFFFLLFFIHLTSCSFLNFLFQCSCFNVNKVDAWKQHTEMTFLNNWVQCTLFNRIELHVKYLIILISIKLFPWFYFIIQTMTFISWVKFDVLRQIKSNCRYLDVTLL